MAESKTPNWQKPRDYPAYFDGLYGDRPNMAEAYQYLDMVAKGSNNYMATYTAAQVLLNTYIKTQVK